MIVPFGSWNLLDTTHVKLHTKVQLIWAIDVHCINLSVINLNGFVWSALASWRFKQILY